MDKRRLAGRTLEELDFIFQQLPDAGMCFDIAHARQVDSSMTEAYRLLRRYAERIRQLHVSEVNSMSKHDRISDAALRSFREVSDAIPRGVPLILETPVSAVQAREQLDRAATILEVSVPHR
jgi:sugar phosphate isomerase/epimerase